MRETNKNERRFLEGWIREIFEKATIDDYARYILTHENEDGVSIMEDIIYDVLTSSAWEDEGYYNEDDIRLAIGRVLMNRLGIEV